MDEYVTPNQAERISGINTTCLIAYMDVGLLRYEIHEGIRFIKHSYAKKLVKLHAKLTREFMDYIIAQGMDTASVNYAIGDREGFLYFRWINLGMKLPTEDISGLVISETKNK